MDGLEKLIDILASLFVVVLMAYIYFNYFCPAFADAGVNPPGCFLR